MQRLTIGKLVKLSGISADTLRYYEKMKLLKAERTTAGYRLYSPDSIKIVRFILSAKALNFTLVEIGKLLSLNGSDQVTCAEMLAFTENKLDEARLKIEELKKIQRLLSNLVKDCPGDNTSTDSCPILDHIRGGSEKR